MPSSATRKRRTAARKAQQAEQKAVAKEKFIRYINSPEGKAAIAAKGPMFEAKIHAMMRRL